MSDFAYAAGCFTSSSAACRNDFESYSDGFSLVQRTLVLYNLTDNCADTQAGRQMDSH